MSRKELPPQWANSLLRKFARQTTLEEVEGDLDELFQSWITESGKRVARRRYLLTVLTLLRPFSGNEGSASRMSISTLLFMINSYFKMSWRTLVKNRVSSLMNISGLTLGLATSIVVLLVVMHEASFDKFHANLRDIYLLMKNQKTNDGVSTGRSTAGPTAGTLREQFPEVKYAVRTAGFDDAQLMIKSSVSYESGIYADPDFFRIMTFPSIAGNATEALENGFQVVLTKGMAEKLFPEGNALGKEILLNKHYSLIVGAVVENVPENSTIKFGMVIPFSLFEKDNSWLTKWDDNRINTWLQLGAGANLDDFANRASKLLNERNASDAETLFAYPLKDIHLYDKFSNGHPNGGDITGLKMLGTFGIFMLAIACINFMNIATAQSEQRAREVGIRKVLGSSRKSIIFQFLNESFVLTFLSLALGIALVYVVLPSFNTLTNSKVGFDLVNPRLWLAIVGFGLITALLAGFYPSLFLSRFLPARVLRGGSLNIKGGGLRRVLVTFQFAISIFFLISTIIMYSQFEYVSARPIGYEQENLIDIHLDSTLGARFSYIKNELLKIPNVSGVTGTAGNILYSGGAVTGMDWPGKKPGQDLSVVVADVDYDWSKTIGTIIVEGRDFDPSFKTDMTKCLINESAVAKMGLENAVGVSVGGHEVLGVVKDFVFNNPQGVVAPMAIYLNPGGVRHCYVRIKNNFQWKETIRRIEKITTSVSSDYPFIFKFTRDEYQQNFDKIKVTSLLFSIFGGMTIFISCLGLFGLSGFVAERRSKEMSIRKVFGADSLRVLMSLSADFLKPVVWALLVMIPLTFWIATISLSHIAYRVPFSWWMFVSAAVIITSIAFTIVFYHGWRTSGESPVVRLRSE